MGHVVHRNPSPQYVVPWEARGKGPEYVVRAPDDDEVVNDDQNKYIMIPPHRRSAGSSLLVPRDPYPRGPAEAYGSDLSNLALVPYRSAPGWVRLVDEGA